eukprot:Phypoly_transcript_00547.p1 GENE.Phypoly_transcript_00547~~Phypoly_transcript_00547.p1  ORF type:complete len:849 (+),score=185.30 Phypoly_transcript_00547:148-2547(+)
MENQSHTSLYVSMRSNLAMQVFIFQDERLSQPAENIYLTGYDKTIVYVCVQPNLNAESYTDGHCRELVGGIRVKVHNLQHTLLYENSMRFSAVVGKSLLRISKGFVDMGATRKLGQTFSSYFTVANASTLLPLKYALSATKNVKLSKQYGDLDGSESNSGRFKEKIQYWVTSSSYGLMEEKIFVVNLASGQKQEITLRLFVDDSSLLTNLPLSHTGIDWLRFDDIYVAPNAPVLEDEDKKKVVFVIVRVGTGGSSTSRSPQSPFTVRNVSNHDIRVYPKSNLALTFTLNTSLPAEVAEQNQEAFHPMDQKRSPFKLCGKPFVLNADQKAVMYTQPPVPSTILSQKKKALLWKGRKVPFHGALVFERSESAINAVNPEEGKMHICKVTTISGAFCLSMGQVTPDVVDVGKVGYENSWKEIRIPIELKNLSEVPLATKSEFTSPGGALYLLSAPTSSPAQSPVPSPVPSPMPSPSLTVVRRGSLPELGKEDVPKIPQPPPVPLQPKASVVPVSESKFFTLVLDVSKLERTAGAFACKAQFVNVNNPQNKMVVNITGVITLTVLKFSRVTDGNNIVLPDLVHPQPQPAQNADEWFSVENLSDKSLKLALEVEVASQLADSITLEVLHKTSNTPIPSFSLRPREVIELRVRAKLRPETRLPEKLEGPMAFGRIGILSNVYPTEIINVKGKITSGPTFSLSVNKINFNTVPRGQSLAQAQTQAGEAQKPPVTHQVLKQTGSGDEATPQAQNAQAQAQAQLPSCPCPSPFLIPGLSQLEGRQRKRKRVARVRREIYALRNVSRGP